MSVTKAMEQICKNGDAWDICGWLGSKVLKAGKFAFCALWKARGCSGYIVYYAESHHIKCRDFTDEASALAFLDKVIN